MTKNNEIETPTDNLSEYGLLPGETFSGFVDLYRDKGGSIRTVVPAKYLPATYARILMGDMTVYVILPDGRSVITYGTAPDDRTPGDLSITEYNVKKFPKSFGLTEIAPDTKHLIAVIETLCRTMGPGCELYLLEYILYQVRNGKFPEGSYPTTIVIDCTEPNDQLKIQYYSIPTLYWQNDALFMTLLYVRLDLGLGINVSVIRSIAEIRNNWDMKSKLILTRTEEEIGVKTVPDGSAEIFCEGNGNDAREVNWNTMKTTDIPIRSVTEDDIQTIIAYLGIANQTLN